MSINPSLLNIRNKDASLRKSGDDIKWRKKIKKDLNEIYGWYDYHMKFSETDGKAETKKYKKKIEKYYKQLNKLSRLKGVGVVIDEKRGKKKSIYGPLGDASITHKKVRMAPVPHNIKMYDITTKRGLNLFVDRADSREKGAYISHPKDFIDKRVKRNRRISRNRNIQKARRDLPRTSIKRSKVANGVRVDITFPFEQLDKDDWLNNIRLNLKRAFTAESDLLIKYVRDAKQPTETLNSYKVALSAEGNPFTDGSAFATSKFTMREWHKVIKEMIDRIERALEQYEEGDEEFDFKTIGLSFIIKPYGQIVGSGGHKTIQQANKQFFIIDTPALFNCFWRCVATHHILLKYSTEDLERLLIKNINMKEFNQCVNKTATKIKSRNKDNLSTIRATDDTTIQRYVNKNAKPKSASKIIINIYDNVFKKIKTIRPVNETEDFTPHHIINIQYINHHFIPLIKWYEFDDERKALLKNYLHLKKHKDFNEESSDEEDECELIERNIYDRDIDDEDAFKKYLKEEMRIRNEETGEWSKAGYDYDDLKKGKLRQYERWFKKAHPECCVHNFENRNKRIGAYDLEATPNGTDNDCFVTYRLSFVYNVLDDENDDIDLPSYLQKALVYYLKARNAEDVGNMELKEYMMREYKKHIEQYESTLMKGPRIISSGFHAIR